MLTAFLVPLALLVGIGMFVTRNRAASPLARSRSTTPADRPIRFKTIIGGAEAPFRANANEVYEEPAARAIEPTTLDAVLAALRAGGLDPKPTRRPGFEIAGSKPETYLRVTVSDPARVDPNTMIVAHTEGELAVDVAFAMVPVFGAIGVDMGAAAWLVVDGSRDVAAIRKELGQRYLAMMQQMMTAMEPMKAMLDQLGAALDRGRRPAATPERDADGKRTKPELS